MMSPNDKPLTWLGGEIHTPPLGQEARLMAGFLLRRLQQGEYLKMPHSRPMQTIGKRCHELRVRDKDLFWRIIYRIDHDAIVIVAVFAKKTASTPKRIINKSIERLAEYDGLSKR